MSPVLELSAYPFRARRLRVWFPSVQPRPQLALRACGDQPGIHRSVPYWHAPSQSIPLRAALRGAAATPPAPRCHAGWQSILLRDALLDFVGFPGACPPLHPKAHLATGPVDSPAACRAARPTARLVARLVARFAAPPDLNIATHPGKSSAHRQAVPIESALVASFFAAARRIAAVSTARAGAGAAPCGAGWHFPLPGLQLRQFPLRSSRQHGSADRRLPAPQRPPFRCPS